MASHAMLCQLYEAGRSWFGNDLADGRYLAVLRCPVEALPEPRRDDDHVVVAGYAVGFGRWYFFPDIAPAIAFGRAARMSAECHAYGVYQAVHETRYCQIHREDELVLHVAGEPVDRRDDEVEHLKRFVQAVKEHPWSSHWHPPTGYITTATGGIPTKTSQRSLPL